MRAFWVVDVGDGDCKNWFTAKPKQCKNWFTAIGVILGWLKALVFGVVGEAFLCWGGR